MPESGIFMVGCGWPIWSSHAGLSENQGLGARGQGLGFRCQLTVGARPRGRLQGLIRPPVSELARLRGGLLQLLSHFHPWLWSPAMEVYLKMSSELLWFLRSAWEPIT